MTTVPNWFEAALAAAKHQDEIATWPWWARLLHKKFRAKSCPACIYWNKQ